MGKRFVRVLKVFINELLDIIYPPKNKCIGCGDDYIGLCPKCKNKIMKVKDDSKILSYGYYSGVMKNLVLEFKYKKNFLAGNILAEYLYELITENNITADGIFFIPSTKKALKERGFNQCEFIARIIGNRLDIPVYKDIIKIKNTKEQKTLSKEERLKNIIGAFEVISDINIKDKNIILIDDVITTGATLLECEKLFIKNGACSIKILTVAKSYI